jgi:hypothetical protein
VLWLKLGRVKRDNDSVNFPIVNFPVSSPYCHRDQGRITDPDRVMSFGPTARLRLNDEHFSPHLEPEEVAMDGPFKTDWRNQAEGILRH